MIWLIHQPQEAEETIRKALEAADYRAYDPFPGGTGSPVGKLTRVRLFVAPSIEEWGRVLAGDPVPEEILQTIGEMLTFINIQLLSAEDYHLSVYKSGQSPNTDISALKPFLRQDKTEADLQAALTQELAAAPDDNADLPPELQQMAQEKGVKAKHVNSLMGRMQRRIARRMQKEGEAAETQEQAMDALKKQNIDWNSQAGQRVMSIVGCLAVPDGWHRPAWKELTAAYPLARQQQRGGDLLLPGDKDTLATVPNALDYTPLYYAKKL